MKPIVTYVCKSRWCRMPLWIAIVIGLFLLLPFARQLVFGPKIDDVPWCVWEREARIAADPERHRSSWLRKIGSWLGLDGGHYFTPSVWKSDSVLPLHVELAQDQDAKVRLFALTHLDSAIRLNNAELLPVMRRHLDDDDVECRFIAAHRVWWKTQDPAAKASLLSLVDCADNHVRENVAEVLAGMAKADRDLFEPLAKLAKDDRSRIRAWALGAMPLFGKRALPTIRWALDDPQSCYAAVEAAGGLGPDAVELIPMLQTLRKDGPYSMRPDIAEALSKIDPMRFPSPGKGPPRRRP
jgi:hypothetical protein